MERLPDGADRQLVEDEMPTGMERRLVLRLLSRWRKICGDREFPSFNDVDPAEMSDLWQNCFVLDVAGFAENPVFRSIGADIAPLAGVNLVDKRVSDAPASTLISASVAYLGEVLRKQVPISRGGEFLKPGGVRVLYRSILLPMSDDGETISGLLGAANCREVIDGQGD